MATETAAESRRNAFIRFGVSLTLRCGNPASPRYHAMDYRGVWHPAGGQAGRIFASLAAVQYHSAPAIETNRPALADVASVLRFT